MGAVILDHRRLARKYVEKLVFLFVPVSVGRTGFWLERLDICAELRHTARIRIAQRLKAAEPFRPSFVPLVVPRYTLSNDHLGAPYAGSTSPRPSSTLCEAWQPASSKG